jgi:hypothetical protein
MSGTDPQRVSLNEMNALLDLAQDLSRLPAPHCEVCEFMDEEGCDRPDCWSDQRYTGHNRWAPAEHAWDGGDSWGYKLWQLEEFEKRMDVEWRDYILRRHGYPSNWKIVARRPSFVFRAYRQGMWWDWAWGGHDGYYGPQYRPSCNGYCSNK